MKAVTFYFWNLEPTPSLQMFVLPFLTLMVNLTFGKILNIRKSHSIGKLHIFVNSYSLRTKDLISVNVQVTAF